MHHSQVDEDGAWIVTKHDVEVLSIGEHCNKQACLSRSAQHKEQPGLAFYVSACDISGSSVQCPGAGCGILGTGGGGDPYINRLKILRELDRYQTPTLPKRDEDV